MEIQNSTLKITFKPSELKIQDNVRQVDWFISDDMDTFIPSNIKTLNITLATQCTGFIEKTIDRVVAPFVTSFSNLPAEGVYFDLNSLKEFPAGEVYPNLKFFRNSSMDGFDFDYYVSRMWNIERLILNEQVGEIFIPDKYCKQFIAPKMKYHDSLNNTTFKNELIYLDIRSAEGDIDLDQMPNLEYLNASNATSVHGSPSKLNILIVGANTSVSLNTSAPSIIRV